ncbi:unnamed protein product [Paramecium sonneborni]|uniref:Signal transduction histidine kinase dimerisation/phosphoacceptor domain-containing protein n=1 Tax=Paramecium sonneborni TaxID=65129 RepID=A0A8S1RUB8_9CILI|nr:unnamed protein product [Paramecium sonneborni]
MLMLIDSYSHELLTPLNCSLQLLQTLEQQLKSDLNDKYLKPVIISNKKLLHQINDILEFANFEVKTFKLRPSILQQKIILKLNVNKSKSNLLFKLMMMHLQEVISIGYCKYQLIYQIIRQNLQSKMELCNQKFEKLVPCINSKSTIQDVEFQMRSYFQQIKFFKIQKQILQEEEMRIILNMQVWVQRFQVKLRDNYEKKQIKYYELIKLIYKQPIFSEGFAIIQLSINNTN